jgi:hypothetical protein
MKKLQYKTVLKAVKKSCEKYKLELDIQMIEMISKQLTEINSIIAACGQYKHWDTLFAICEKMPRNLDSGRHYYSINYVHDNRIKKLFLGDFIKVVHGDIQNRDKCIDKYIFSSGAIGMSRTLDATDGLFSYLREIGGYYTQLNCR